MNLEPSGSRILRICAGTLVLLLIGLVAVVSRNSTAKLTLSDGSEISFAGVTTGKNHRSRVIPGYQWKIFDLQQQKRLGWILNPILRRMRPFEISTTGERAHVLWFELSRPALQKRHFAAQLVDEDNRALGSPLRLHAASPTTAHLVVWSITEGLHKVKSIRIYELDSPLHHGPTADFLADLILQNPIGAFSVDASLFKP